MSTAAKPPCAEGRLPAITDEEELVDRILRPQYAITVAKDTEKPDPGATIARNRGNVS